MKTKFSAFITVMLSLIVLAGCGTSDTVYTSEELGYKLNIPEEWLDYNYYVEHEYTGGQSMAYESWEDKYYGDFEDWQKYQMLVIGSAPKSIFEANFRDYEAWVERCEKIRNEPTSLVSEYCYPQEFPGPFYTLLEKDYITFYETPGEKGGHVYYSYSYGHDSPEKFLEDGSPLPNLEVDFTYTGDQSS